jgi:predicted TIM-barrel fold metal-dependent hydrolase
MDCHFHAFHRGLPRSPQARYVPSYNADFASLRALWSEHGITRGVLVQPSFLGADNSYLLQLCEQHSDILRGVAVVHTSTPLAELKSLVERGVRGLRFNWFGVVDLPGSKDPEWLALGRAMAAAGLHAELHVESARLQAACALFDDWKLPLVVDHLGRPNDITDIASHCAFIEQLADRRSLHLKLSAPYRCGTAFGPVTRRLLQNMGSAHFIWGSDWPFTQHESSQQYADQLAQLHTLGLSAVERQAFKDNAARLYFEE